MIQNNRLFENTGRSLFLKLVDYSQIHLAKLEVKQRLLQVLVCVCLLLVVFSDRDHQLDAGHINKIVAQDKKLNGLQHRRLRLSPVEFLERALNYLFNQPNCFAAFLNQLCLSVLTNATEI